MNDIQRIARLILTVIAITLLAACSAGSETVAKGLMENLKSGKHLAVEESLSKEMHSFAAAFGGINDANLNAYYRTGAMAEYRLEEKERAENSIRYSVLVTTTDNKKYQNTVTLVKEDGKWKIGKF